MQILIMMLHIVRPCHVNILLGHQRELQSTSSSLLIRVLCKVAVGTPPWCIVVSIPYHQASACPQCWHLAKLLHSRLNVHGRCCAHGRLVLAPWSNIHAKFCMYHSETLLAASRGPNSQQLHSERCAGTLPFRIFRSACLVRFPAQCLPSSFFTHASIFVFLCWPLLSCSCRLQVCLPASKDLQWESRCQCCRAAKLNITQSCRPTCSL